MKSEYYVKYSSQGRLQEARSKNRQINKKVLKTSIPERQVCKKQRNRIKVLATNIQKIHKYINQQISTNT